MTISPRQEEPFISLNGIFGYRFPLVIVGAQLELRSGITLLGGFSH